MSSSTSTPGPLQEYFSQYPAFDYHSDRSPTSEFYRMCDFFDWDREDHARKDAYEAFRDAITQQFNVNYGTDANSLASWQLLCDRVGVYPIPNTLKECRKIVMDTHVNLVDLVDGGVARVFSSEQELSSYTISTGKFFPSENAYAGDLLRHLLRHIFHPRSEMARGHGRGQRRGNRGRGGRGRRGAVSS